MHCKKSLKVNFPLSLLLALLLLPSLNYAQTDENYKNDQQHRFDYRRIDQNNLPPVEKYAQSKQEVFPLSYGKNHLNKVTTGTGVWTELNPKVPRVTYLGLHFVNKDTGWACGQSGAVIKTKDGGSNWIISETTVNNLLLKTHSYNSQVVLVTGYDGIILRSSDGGENFEQVPSGVGNGYDLWGVQMLNDTLGWVCGGYQTLLKTTDAGSSWQPVNTGLNQHYWAVDFINKQYGMIACSGGKILKTIDGGNMWTQIQTGDTRALYTIDVIDSLHIIVAGEGGKNVYSSDAGVTWISNPNIPAATATNWIDFIDADTGYSVQDFANIRKTTNRGQSWFNPTGTYFLSEWHIQLLEDGTGYSCGEEVGWIYSLNFYKRTNGLDNWSRLFINDNFNDVHFITESTGFALSTLLYKTVDGGINWQELENESGGYDIVFTDSLTGFIANDNSSIYKTIDGGNNWYLTNVPAPAGDFRKIFFINSTTGWAVTIWTTTSNAKILKTTDGGENWFVQVQQSAPDGFTSIFFTDSLNGWATSRYVWQSTNGGNNWIQRTDIPAFFSQDIYFIENSGFTIEPLNLYKTTDSGENWFIQLTPQYIIRSFGWLDNERGFIIGDGVYETADTGNTWQEILEIRNTGIRKFQAPLKYVGYSTGYKGLIYKYIDSSYIPVELISFEWKVGSNEVILFWETATEINNQGFYIEKSLNKVRWETVGFVNGKGTTTEINSYSFVDQGITDLKMFYRIKQVDFDGSFLYSQIIEIEILVNNFTLSQNFPNPANPSTNISFSVPEKSNVKINLYSISGEVVKDLIDEEKDTGIYSITINLNDLATGVYLYRMTTSKGYSDVKKLILLK